jgi:hypothetical protein
VPLRLRHVPTISRGTPLEIHMWEMGRRNQHFSFVGKEPISATAEAVGPHGPKPNAPSPEPVQASDLTLISGTRYGSPLSAGVSGSDSFAIDPTTLELGGIWEGHQSDSRTSGTQCHVNLPIPRRARSTVFQRMCAHLGETGKLVGPWL